ncbi:hypothetical protein GSI_09470 [Ganoderma sinense ZZ0214-1]|uniref:Myb/SANT-like domain-containing protein n=1 Tax=Ganoderma sinense ZZ0214-1 TaxID=1077348 RepID=A0A2G8S795_9APHY|nr:hypothetical protein GSI_09470 [Ganoderma sinense ZZ0214-1]
MFIVASALLALLPLPLPTQCGRHHLRALAHPTTSPPHDVIWRWPSRSPASLVWVYYTLFGADWVHYGNSDAERLKGEFVLVQKMRGQSGFGWDETTKTVTATKEVWDPFLKQYPKAKDLLGEPFPLYDELLTLVDGAVATGNFIFRSGKGGQSGAQAAPAEAPAGTPSRSQEGAPSTPPSVAREGAPEVLDLTEGDGADNVDRAASHKKGRVSDADALLSVSHVICSVGDALTIPALGLMTPQCKAKAIALVEEDEDMSETEVVQVAKMFRVQPDIADTYVALKSKATQSSYVPSELDDFMNRSD